MTQVALRVGETIDGKLEIVRALGAGGMGAVWEARHARTGRSVAIKVLRPELAQDVDLCRRFLNEALACGRIRHPNVVDVLDAGVDAGRPYLVMELLEGESLAARMAREGPLSIDDSVRCVLEACAGVAAAHAAGIVHRDLKPENLFVARTGEDERVVKVVDFGISKIADEERGLEVTRTGVVVGTPYYMSPEQARGARDVDGRTDVWALGAVLFHALTGRPPFVAENYNALIASLLTEDVPRPRALRPEIPEAIESVVLRALERDRERRWPTVIELGRALASASGATFSASGVGVRGSLDPALAATLAATPAPQVGSRVALAPSRRRRAPLVLMAVGSVGALALAGALALGGAFRGGARAGVQSAADEGDGAMEVSMAAPALEARRVAVIATGDPGASVDARLAWALASRIVEEIDRYDDLRPTSPAGILAARVAELGDPDALPDELGAVRIARRSGAGTVVSLAVRPTEGGQGLAVSTHVFSTDDLARGRSAPPESLGREDLDADGPRRIAGNVLEALRRHLGVEAFRGSDAMPTMEADFATYEQISDAASLLTIGDYAAAESAARAIIARYPESASAWSMLACAMSFGGDEEGIDDVVARVESLRERATSRRERIVIDQDLAYVAADRARRAGRTEEARRLGRQVLELDLDLAHEYGDPLGFLYAATAQQYLLGDVDAARHLLAEARARAPWLYPAYYEEAKLVRGDGRSARGRRHAARLLGTYLQCNPDGAMADRARATLREWGLEAPREPLPCPTLRAE